MIITSEKTGKQYKTVEECLAAEKAYDIEVAQKKAAEEKLIVERKARAKKVEDKIKKASEAQKDAQEELRAFVRDYGSFHTSLTTEDTPWFFDIFDAAKAFYRK